MQLRIEAQGKYLQAVLEKAQDTLGRQNLGTVGLEAAKVQLSELVSKVSTQCLNSAFSGINEFSGLCPIQNQTIQPADCSIESCLTEASQRDHHINNSNIGLTPFNDLKDKRKAFTMEMNSSDLSMSIGIQGGKWNGNNSNRDSEERFRGRNEDINFLDQTMKRTDSVKPENEDLAQAYELSYFAPKLDLNSHDENGAASRCKQFDLNGFSWC